MICQRCFKEAPEGAKFCPWCGFFFNRTYTPKKRGNGQGTVFKLQNGHYIATVVVGYYTGEDGKRHKQTRSRVYEKKKDAVAALPGLASNPKREIRKQISFKSLYDTWLPTHRAGKSTLDCYKAAIKHFKPLWTLRIADIDVDDLQECLDACPAGKRTRENMRAVVGLMYKYGIPRKLIPDNLNLAPFLAVDGEGAAHREAFTDVQIEMIRKAVGKVPYADYVYAMIYTGFRPSEFLALTPSDYNKAAQSLTGGAKTEAGRGRVVTVSPKIRGIVEQCATSGDTIFSDAEGKAWRLQDFTETAFILRWMPSA